MSRGPVIAEAPRPNGEPSVGASAAFGSKHLALRGTLPAALLAAAIFCLDAFTRDDLAVAGLYVLVPLIAASEPGPGRRRSIILWSLACAVLALAGYGVFLSRGAPPLALAHLAISLTVLCVTTLLLLRTSAMDAAVARSERRYRTVFDTLAVAIWEHDFSPVAERIRSLREGGVEDLSRFLLENPDSVVEMRRMVRITDVNATALKMMGVTTKEAFFERLSDFLPETDESFAECILAIDERRSLFQAEATVLPLSGEPRDIIVAFGLGADADLTRVPGSILDISGRKALEAQVLRSREDLAQAQRDTALAAMSASIAHELNQPMSAIHSYADAARRWMARTPPNIGEATSALRGLVDAIGHARAVMQRVRSLVGSSRLEGTELDLCELIGTAVSIMRRDAVESRTRIAFFCNGEQHVLVKGDRVLLKQVLVNLVDNAVQAMTGLPPESRIVTVELSTDAGEAVIKVIDRGQGWEQGAHEKVFGSFYTTKPNGMGLGLSISRTTVERHGGSIKLRDANGGGAIVEVSLPLASAGCHGGLHRDLEDVAVQRLVQ